MLVAACVLVAIFGNGRIDLAIADLLYDSAVSDFVWRQNLWVDQYLYHWPKIAAVLAAVFLILWGVAKVRAKAPLFTWRHLAVGVIGSVAIPLAVAALKTLTGIECPWSLDRYGGVTPYRSLLDVITDGAGQGRCFPAGHSGVGFYLFAWCAAWIDSIPVLGVVLGVFGLAVGVLLGFTRMAQGAHFLSHILWSGWVATMITMLLRYALLGKRPPHPADTSGTSSTS